MTLYQHLKNHSKKLKLINFLDFINGKKIENVKKSLLLDTILHWEGTKMELETDDSPNKTATIPIKNANKKQVKIGKTRVKIKRMEVKLKPFLGLSS